MAAIRPTRYCRPVIWILAETDETATFDGYRGFVVRAQTETQARTAAAKAARTERWRMQDKTSCLPVDAEGPVGVLLAAGDEEAEPARTDNLQ